MSWKCVKGHNWEASWASIKDMESWCPTCARQSRNKKLNLTDLQLHAKSRNGLLLSKVYANCNQLLLWKCDKRHQWKASWRSILYNKSWCPICKLSKTEVLVKELLEKKLNITFKKKHLYYDPIFKQKYYELDGYNEKYKIAFEYNGEQHYTWKPHWHTKQEFLELQQRDKDKEQYCIENGITLIVIPYTIKDLVNYISNLSIPVLV